MSEQILSTLIGAVVFLLVVFLILRVFMLWYWKINIMVEKLESISSDLKQIRVAMESEVASRPKYI